jgi:hypothetical protein
MSQAETLQQGRPPRPPHPHRTARLAVTAVVLLVVVAVSLVVDHRRRERESDRVAGCVAEATSSTRYAFARLDSVLGYVRPVIDSDATTELRRSMDLVVSGAVRPVVPDVRRARSRCAAVEVLPWHGGLIATRDACRAVLAHDLELLDNVAAGGTRGLRSSPAPAGRCVTG